MSIQMLPYYSFKFPNPNTDSMSHVFWDRILAQITIYRNLYENMGPLGTRPTKILKIKIILTFSHFH